MTTEYVVGKEYLHPSNKPEDFERLQEDRKDHLLKWINDRLVGTKQFNRRESSYWLKRIYEDECFRENKYGYVTNGQFKGAMLKCGHEPYDRAATNWHFKTKVVILG